MFRFCSLVAVVKAIKRVAGGGVLLFCFHSPLSARQNGAHNIADDPVLLTTQGGRKKLQRLEHVDIRVQLRGGGGGKETAGRIGGGVGGVRA